MNYKKGVAPLIIVLAIVIVVGGGLTLYKTSLNTEIETSAVITQTPSSIPTITLIPSTIVSNENKITTTEWKIYKNKYFGEFKYPKEFSFFYQEDGTLKFVNESDISTAEKISASFAIKKVTTDEIGFTNLGNNRINYDPVAKRCYSRTFSTNEITYNDKVVNGNTVCTMSDGDAGIDLIQYYIIHPDEKYAIRLSSRSDQVQTLAQIDEILYTFKFVE